MDSVKPCIFVLPAKLYSGFMNSVSCSTFEFVSNFISHSDRDKIWPFEACEILVRICQI